MQGVIMAEALSITLGIPMYKINHLTGHIYSLFIEQKSVQAPISILLVSGGHTQIMQMIDLQNITTISKSLDDSFGESFDKTAKMLGLGYPGGPIVQSLAQNGDENRFNFPVPLIGSPTLDFSYSGLKNSVRLAILEQKEKTNDILDDDFISDICASFQKKAIEHIVNKTKRYFKKNIINNFAIVGGASANIALRLEIESICKQNNCKLHLAPLKFCSDNAAMIGRVGVDLHNCNT
jgi:N6-L-threonylcarbamoyladenine synthase